MVYKYKQIQTQIHPKDQLLHTARKAIVELFKQRWYTNTNIKNTQITILFPLFWRLKIRGIQPWCVPVILHLQCPSWCLLWIDCISWGYVCLFPQFCLGVCLCSSKACCVFSLIQMHFWGYVFSLHILFYFCVWKSEAFDLGVCLCFSLCSGLCALIYQVRQ